MNIITSMCVWCSSVFARIYAVFINGIRDWIFRTYVCCSRHNYANRHQTPADTSIGVAPKSYSAQLFALSDILIDTENARMHKRVDNIYLTIDARVRFVRPPVAHARTTAPRCAQRHIIILHCVPVRARLRWKLKREEITQSVDRSAATPAARNHVHFYNMFACTRAISVIFCIPIPRFCWVVRYVCVCQ